jgi:hypothetical protein
MIQTIVMPAQAGIQFFKAWTPAFAGVTVMGIVYA